MPVRSRARDADGAARRHRPRRAARHPDQGPAGARVDPPRRHDRARQDRHGHRGQADARRRGHRPGHVARPRRCGSSARSSTRRSTRSRVRSQRRVVEPLEAVEGFRPREGLGAEGVVDGHARRGRTAGAARRVGSNRRTTISRGRSSAAPRPSSRRGTARRAQSSSSPTR